MDDYRLKVERDRLQALHTAYPEIVRRVTASPTLRSYEVEIAVAAPVGVDEGYRVEHVHLLTLTIPDEFPESSPLARFKRPILVPNIWSNGFCCITDHVWTPAQHLDALVCSIIEEMQGIEPNFASIANVEAGRLFATAGFIEKLRARLGPPVTVVPPVAETPPPGPGPIRPRGQEAPALPIRSRDNALLTRPVRERVVVRASTPAAGHGGAL